jgi:hypothetical protein
LSTLAAIGCRSPRAAPERQPHSRSRLAQHQVPAATRCFPLRERLARKLGRLALARCDKHPPQRFMLPPFETPPHAPATQDQQRVSELWEGFLPIRQERLPESWTLAPPALATRDNEMTPPEVARQPCDRSIERTHSGFLFTAPVVVDEYCCWCATDCSGLRSRDQIRRSLGTGRSGLRPRREG